VIVVTRYFGGTKLGAGGLIRAYGGAAKLAVSQAEKQLYISTTQVSIQVPLDDVGSLYQVIQQFQGNDQFQKLREYQKLRDVVMMENQVVRLESLY